MIRTSNILRTSLCLILGLAVHTVDAGNDLSLNSKDVAEASVSETLSNSEDPNHSWVKATHARVLQFWYGSGVLVGKTPQGLGIFLSAAHVRGVAPEAREGNAEMLGLSQSGGSDIAVVPRGNSSLKQLAYSIYAPKLSVTWEEYAKHKLAGLLPREDFYWGLLSGAKLPVNDMTMSEEVNLTPLDHTHAASDLEATVTPKPGQRVLALGFPRRLNKEFSYTVGRVLADADAEKILQGSTPDEARIPFDRNVEFMIEGVASVGMSGGPVFDGQGRLMGISVRAGSSGERRYVRVVKLKYALEQLVGAYENKNLEGAGADQLKPFLTKFIPAAKNAVCVGALL